MKMRAMTQMKATDTAPLATVRTIVAHDMRPRKCFQREKYGMVHQHQHDKVIQEDPVPEPSGTGNASLPDIVTGVQQPEQRRAGKGDEQRGDGVHTGSPHGQVHRNARGQPRQQQHDRRRVERQQRDESHVDERIEVNADGQVVEKEDLQEHHNGEECEIWERPVHLSVLSGMLFYFLTVLQFAHLREVAVLDEDHVRQARHLGRQPHVHPVSRTGLVQMGALDPADQHVGREILRKPGRHDLLPGCGSA